MRKTIKHRFSVSQEKFWQEIYFNPEYTCALFLKGMGCIAFEVMSQSGSLEEGLKRQIKSTPEIEIPKPIKKVLGDVVSYTESGTYDSKTQHYKFEVVPSAMAGKIRIAGDYWVEPCGENEVERVCELNVDVKIFGVGKLIEQFVAKSYVDNQEKAARFTKAWIAGER